MIEQEIPVDLPDKTRRMAEVFTRICQDREVGDGHRTEDMLAAGTFAAVRQRDEPIQFREIVEAAGADRTAAFSLYQDLTDTIDIHPPDHYVFVRRIVDELELDDDVHDRAEEILRDGYQGGASAMGLAAGAVAAATDDRRTTQREIAAVAGITEQTVSENKQRLE